VELLESRALARQAEMRAVAHPQKSSESRVFRILLALRLSQLRTLFSAKQMSSSKAQAAKELFSKFSLKAKQVVYNLSEVAVKAQEATNNDKWGPHGQLLNGACTRSRRGIS
jgi:hypothetical protein